MIRIQRFIQDMEQSRWLGCIELPQWQVQRTKYVVPGKYEDEQEVSALEDITALQGIHGTTYRLGTTLDIPPEWEDGTIGLVFETRGEGLLRVNGQSYHGLDRNHGFVPLPRSRTGMNPVLEVELYDPIPEPRDPLNRQATINPPIRGIRAALVHVNRPLQSLMYSVKVLAESLRELPEADLKRGRLIQAVHRIMDEMYGNPERWSDAGWVGEFEHTLALAVQEADPEQARPGFMHLIGQSHIDVAWLWPVRETVRKTSRTFSTMCALMDEYPDFVYSQSQPQLYAFAKEHYPELYERVKARIAEGRWELVGGMWVEPDLNIPSGESLVRQMLYGQRFYEAEFGKRSKIEWLPDTFGYCASLPQLLKQAGISYFMTTKLNWNDTNVFPHDLFEWVGIDGTSVLSYLNHGVNEHTRPKDVAEHWQSYRQKGVHPEQMLLYGHGDGGGGVTSEMVEMAEKAAFMVGQPVSRFSTAASFFEGITERQPELPQWHGDLYLELHRGTYTTHARNKRSNRKAEVLYREAEVWGQLAGLMSAAPAMASPIDFVRGAAASGADPAQLKGKLDEGWKLIMLNQFHDIIPGTSIPEVYVTSAQEYAQVFELGTSALTGALDIIAGQVATDGAEGQPYIIFNSMGWERDEVIEITLDSLLQEMVAYDQEGHRLECELVRSEGVHKLLIHVNGIPAFGYTTLWLRQDDRSEAFGESDRMVGLDHASDTGNSVPSRWETDEYVLEFNEVGEITRWYDKSLQREWLKPGEMANELQLFHDRPTYWDAWDIDPRFESQRADRARLISSEVVRQGGVQDVLRFRWELGASKIEQDIVLCRHQRRVDFRTRVQWAESHKLLKVAFPVDLVATRATYEIPFGTLERSSHANTSWEQAQFEVCGHRWADLSEGNGGVSLLNDCKYGYDIKKQTLRLSLLRAPKWPDEHADQGEHEFAYSLLPHAGDWRDAGVVRRAMELNHPVQVVAAERHAGTLPGVYAYFRFDSKHVILDTVKAAEDGLGTILRFYESSGGRETVELRLPQTSIRACTVNLLEDEGEELFCQDGVLRLAFKPYEVRSVKLMPMH